ncbi:hypothetical protein A3J41_00015 [candidate division TM6 bacterium RIFCSPHIGHO2_12_FULL_38_8]|nr:MAG: hypothetical protein A3J41_00015 [candidate division TM6 bacterium RIFCSPHIGHO2_12_FULL_38_8]
MIDRRFIALFIISFSLVSISGWLWWKLFYLEKQIPQMQEEDRLKSSSAYQEIDLILPVQEFLKRGANSANLSTVKRLFVNQWIYFNQDDLIKLIMYAQGATSFDEMKKAFESGITTEGTNNGAASFITGTIATIAQDPQLIDHVNTSLKQGLTPEIHQLRGKMMDVEFNGREYKKLKNEYRKALYAWIDKKHGALLDNLIVQI